MDTKDRSQRDAQQMLGALQWMVICAALWYTYQLGGLFLATVLLLLLCSLGIAQPFPVLYWLYTTHLGYYVKDVLHPRVPESHSKCKAHHYTGFSVQPVAILADNYAYVVWCHASKQGFVVDPADPQAVAAAIPDGVTITHILTTHKHWDHAGGNTEFNQLCGGKLTIVGSAVDRPLGLTLAVQDGETLAIGELRVSVHDAPGHTRGHLVFAAAVATSAAGEPALFTGDALFHGGVGAFFEGNSRDLLQLHTLLHRLPLDAAVFCGHEYSLTLLKQALKLDPANDALRDAYQATARLRAARESTLPSTLRTQLAVNPFLRVDRGFLQDAARKGMPSEAVQERMLHQATTATAPHH